MYSKLKFLDKLINKIVYDTNAFFIYIPGLIITLIGIKYTVDLFNPSFLPAIAELPLYALLLNALLAFMAYRAGVSADEEGTRTFFHEIAQKFFYATILFALANVLSYSFEDLTAAKFNEFLKGGIKPVIIFLGRLFFYYGVIYTLIILETLYRTLFRIAGEEDKENEEGEIPKD